MVIGDKWSFDGDASASTSREKRPMTRPSSSTDVPATARREVIPQFYFKNGPPAPPEKVRACIAKIDAAFRDHPDGLDVSGFGPILKNICDLPRYLRTCLFAKLDSKRCGRVTRDQFYEYWIGGNMITKDLETRLFLILKKPHKKYLTHEDFMPFMKVLADTHPSLYMMSISPDIKLKYQETVVCRLFHYLNKSGSGWVTLKDLKAQTDVLCVMEDADDCDDINEVEDFFSFENFYVLYVSFLDLDLNKDWLLSKSDLIKYGGFCLSPQVIDRIFAGAPRKLMSNVPGMIDYRDFVFFMLSEVDKTSATAIEYWFNCLDLDGNGIITCDELKYFYNGQVTRMRRVRRNCRPFEEAVGRIFDMVVPTGKDFLALEDLLDSTMAGEFYDYLFNLKTFMAYELRSSKAQNDNDNPNAEREKVAESNDWDAFAQMEHLRLTVEEREKDDIFENMDFMKEYGDEYFIML